MRRIITNSAKRSWKSLFRSHAVTHNITFCCGTGDPIYDCMQYKFMEDRLERLKAYRSVLVIWVARPCCARPWGCGFLERMTRPLSACHPKNVSRARVISTEGRQPAVERSRIQRRLRFLDSAALRSHSTSSRQAE